MKFNLFLFVSFTLIGLSCTSNNADSYDGISEYLTANKLVITDTLSGVFVSVVNEGSKEKPQIATTKSITFKVIGEYLDGTIFDNNNSELATTINMGVMLEGLRIGITKFGRGGSGTIIVPPSLGFGSNPPRGVRANATLAFKIELIDFK